jgi:hypothetical protein
MDKAARQPEQAPAKKAGVRNAAAFFSRYKAQAAALGGASLLACTTGLLFYEQSERISLQQKIIEGQKQLLGNKEAVNRALRETVAACKERVEAISSSDPQNLSMDEREAVAEATERIFGNPGDGAPHNLDTLLTLYYWFRINIRYEKNEDVLIPPSALFANGRGDCKDQAYAMAAILRHIRWPEARLVYTETHAFVQARMPDGAWPTLIWKNGLGATLESSGFDDVFMERTWLNLDTTAGGPGIECDYPGDAGRKACLPTNIIYIRP